MEWITRKIISLDAKLLQYRNKTGDLEEKKSDLLLIKKLCDIPLIIDDDITLAKYCDGIHLGQEDILSISANITAAAATVRDIIGKDKIFGLSTHNAQEIKEANLLPIDYIGLGAYRDTNTKNVTNILGDKLDLLARLSTKPVAAIGGIKLNDKFQYAEYIVVGSGLYEN